MVMATDGPTLVRADSTGDGYVFPEIDLGSTVPRFGIPLGSRFYPSQKG